MQVSKLSDFSSFNTPVVERIFKSIYVCIKNTLQPVKSNIKGVLKSLKKKLRCNLICLAYYIFKKVFKS